MRITRGLVASVLLAAAVGCSQAPTATPAPAPVLPTAALTSTPPPTATPAPPPAATATPPVTPQPAAAAPLAVEGQALRALVLVPGSGVRYGLLARGLALSEDGGRTWRRVTGLTLPAPLVSPHDYRTLYAGDIPSCYRDDAQPIFRRSTDGGASWQELAAGRGIRPVAVHPDRATMLYGISCAGLNVSRDGGQTWQTTGPTQGWDITDILPLTAGQLRFLAILTSEGGTSHLAWFDAEGRLAQNLTQGLTFWGRGVLAAAGSTLYLADSVGVWRSDDGATWKQFREGLADVALAADPLQEGVPEAAMQRGFGLFALAPDPADGRRLALGTVRGLYVSEDRGEHWRPASVEALAQRRIDQVAWDPVAPGTLYATTAEGVYAVRLP